MLTPGKMQTPWSPLFWTAAGHKYFSPDQTLRRAVTVTYCNNKPKHLNRQNNSHFYKLIIKYNLKECKEVDKPDDKLEKVGER